MITDILRWVLHWLSGTPVETVGIVHLTARARPVALTARARVINFTVRERP